MSTSYCLSNYLILMENLGLVLNHSLGIHMSLVYCFSVILRHKFSLGRIMGLLVSMRTNFCLRSSYILRLMFNYCTFGVLRNNLFSILSMILSFSYSGWNILWLPHSMIAWHLQINGKIFIIEGMQLKIELAPQGLFK